MPRPHGPVTTAPHILNWSLFPAMLRGSTPTLSCKAAKLCSILDPRWALSTLVHLASLGRGFGTISSRLSAAVPGRRAGWAARGLQAHVFMSKTLSPDSASPKRSNTDQTSWNPVGKEGKVGCDTCFQLPPGVSVPSQLPSCCLWVESVFLTELFVLDTAYPLLPEQSRGIER